MRIQVIENPHDDLREAVNSELRHHNETSNPVYWEKAHQPGGLEQDLSIFAFGPEGTVLGGLFATTRLHWLKIEIMATRFDHRRQGVGRALLERAELVARQRACKYAYVDTMDYQAPDFYGHRGYRVVGALPDWDSHGHTKFMLVKSLIYSAPVTLT